VTKQVSPSDIPRDVMDLCRELHRHGYEAWVVGGCMRDLLREKPAADWDLATSARPEDVKRVFNRVIPTGIEHGTVTVRKHGKSYEVTTLRGEGAYSDGRRPDQVEFVHDIVADLARRDFTINAIAYDPIADKLSDPFDGVGDLRRRVIRAVGDATRRFSEDGLRVLRAARFAATLEFTIDAETEAAIGATLDTFRKVSAERVREEWMKALKARKPSQAFEIMARTGMLAVTAPLLANLPDAEWRAALACLDLAEAEPCLRLSALFHPVADLGALAEWLTRYRFSNAEREQVLTLLRFHAPTDVDGLGDAALRRHARAASREWVHAAAQLGCLVAQARHGEGSQAHESALRLAERLRLLITADTALSSKELALTGRDLMAELALAPGPELGKILDRLLNAVIEEPSLNTRDALITLARRIRTEA